MADIWNYVTWLVCVISVIASLLLQGMLAEVNELSTSVF